MAKKPQLSDADAAAFKEAMKDVKPLIHTKINVTQPPILPKKRRAEPTLKENTATLFPFSDYETLAPVENDALMEFFRAGIQHKVLRKMRTGQYTIEARLDLHGMTVVKAREALGRFIIECSRKRIRHVLIIHGKGRAHANPVLKNKLNHWLRQTNDILAFCSAKASEGGAGALYVLLRGQRP